MGNNKKQSYKQNLSKVGAKYIFSESVYWGDDELTNNLNDMTMSIGLLPETELTINGTVLYTDGNISILRIDSMYMELECYTLSLTEIKEKFPFFDDPESQWYTKYLCLDIRSEESLFWVEDDMIYNALFDDDHWFMGYDTPENEDYDDIDIDNTYDYLLEKVTSLKKQIDSLDNSKLAEIRKIFLEFSKKINTNINNTGLYDSIDILLSDNDLESLEDNSQSLDIDYHSINRTIQWLTNKDCASLTTWRGKDVKTREENNKTNKELMEFLRKEGYGVIKLHGCYYDQAGDIQKEDSFLVVNHDTTSDNFFNVIYSLSEKYEQECFLYKKKDEEYAYLVGTNDDFGKGKIVLAGKLHIDSNTAENFSEISHKKISFE